VEGGRVKKFLRTNIRLKIMALGFSVALWFFIAGQKNSEVGFLVSLGFKGVPKDMVMTSTPPGEVEVRVLGPRLIINNLSPTQVKVELDLSGANVGPNTLKITKEDIELPLGVKVTRIRPDVFKLRMGRIVSAKLPVKPVVKGTPLKGFTVVEVSVVPEEVTVSGLDKDVSGLKSISTTSVNISGADSTRSFTTGFDLRAREFRSLSDDSVMVRIIIEKEDAGE
jgi:YbbR domain-containing protein